MNKKNKEELLQVQRTNMKSDQQQLALLMKQEIAERPLCSSRDALLAHHPNELRAKKRDALRERNELVVVRVNDIE